MESLFSVGALYSYTKTLSEILYKCNIFKLRSTSLAPLANENDPNFESLDRYGYRAILYIDSNRIRKGSVEEF